MQRRNNSKAARLVGRDRYGEVAFRPMSDVRKVCMRFVRIRRPTSDLVEGGASLVSSSVDTEVIAAVRLSHPCSSQNPSC